MFNFYYCTCIHCVFTVQTINDYFGFVIQFFLICYIHLKHLSLLVQSRLINSKKHVGYERAYIVFHCTNYKLLRLYFSLICYIHFKHLSLVVQSRLINFKKHCKIWKSICDRVVPEWDENLHESAGHRLMCFVSMLKTRWRTDWLLQ